MEREQEKASLADERAQLEADAERRDKYGFKLTGGNLSLEDAFLLQKDPRVRKGQAPYKTLRKFVKALREEGLTRNRFPERTKEMIGEASRGPRGTTTNEGVEETTPKAVKALFKLKAERRQEQDRERYKQKAQK